jgi:hypothetical protein
MLSDANKSIILSVVMLNVVMLNVVAPYKVNPINWKISLKAIKPT